MSEKRLLVSVGLLCHRCLKHTHAAYDKDGYPSVAFRLKTGWKPGDGSVGPQCECSPT